MCARIWWNRPRLGGARGSSSGPGGFHPRHRSDLHRAIHGEEIRSQDALAVAETGGELLEGLEQFAREYAATHPQAREVISKVEVEAYQKSHYRLTTVIPYVDNPQRLTYVLSHEELEEFFDGYSEFGEFVVGIERLPNKNSA